VLRVGGAVRAVEFVRGGVRRWWGKVVLAGGAFGSPKILWQSGIGTRDQLEIVRAARGS
jgi:choline dehydrogenase-like flavoprotein